MGLKTVCLSLTAALFLLFVFISIISDDIQGIEVNNGDGGSRRRNKVVDGDGKVKGGGKSNIRKRESGSAASFVDEYGNEGEINVGGKRFKLYEKKNLNYKKAKAYCKKHDGILAQAMNLEEMRRLQVLITRAKSISSDMWVGADRKEWKKHSLKMQRRPQFGPDPALFGGGPTEMCPALGVSTRSLIPVMCTQELPFICEFEANAKIKTEAPKRAGKGKTVKPAAKKKDTQFEPKTGGGAPPNVIKVNANTGQRVEMKRRRRKKREIILPPTHSHPSTVATENAPPGSMTTDRPGGDDNEDIIELGVTSNPVTENPASVAAEHKLGFAPHAEHLAGPSGGTTPIIFQEDPLLQVEEKAESVAASPDNDVEGADGDGSIMVGKAIRLAATTTIHPDQMLINLMDEQTMNLTAIELEAAEATNNAELKSGSHDHTQQSPSGSHSSKIVDFLDNNDLGPSQTVLPSTSEGLETGNSTSENAELREFNSSSDALDLYYNSSDVTPSNTETNERLVSVENSSTASPDYSSPTSTEPQELKRPHRKAFSEAAPLQNSSAGSLKDAAATTTKEQTQPTAVATTTTSQAFSTDEGHGSPVTMTTASTSPEQGSTTEVLSQTPVPVRKAHIGPADAEPFSVSHNSTTTESHQVTDSSNSTSMLLDAPQEMIVLEEGYVVTELDLSNSTNTDV